MSAAQGGQTAFGVPTAEPGDSAGAPWPQPRLARPGQVALAVPVALVLALLVTGLAVGPGVGGGLSCLPGSVATG